MSYILKTIYFIILLEKMKHPIASRYSGGIGILI